MIGTAGGDADIEWFATPSIHKDVMMKRLSTILTVLIISSGTLGCSMCCGPYDFDYPTFGGKHERMDRSYGRVGSIFSDPNAGYYGESADSNLEPQPAVRNISPDTNRNGMEEDPAASPGGPGELLEPGPGPDDDPTASRLWKPRPLRSQFQWR